MVENQVIVLSPDQVEDLIERTIKRVLEDSDDAPLDVKGAAKFLKMSEGTIYNYVSENRIPFFKKGKRTLFYKDELIVWLKQDQK